MYETRRTNGKRNDETEARRLLKLHDKYDALSRTANSTTGKKSYASKCTKYAGKLQRCLNRKEPLDKQFLTDLRAQLFGAGNSP